MRDDLSTEGFANALHRKLGHHLHRLFTYNKAIRRCSIKFQLQLLSTFAISTVAYLIGVVKLTAADIAPMDAAIRNTARNILGLPGKTPAELVTALSRIPSLELACVRDRERFYYQLVLSPRAATAISTKLLNVLRNEHVPGHSGRWPRCLSNWQRDTVLARAAEARRGVVHVVPTLYRDVTKSAAVTARLVVTQSFWRELQRRRFEPVHSQQAALFASPPPGVKDHIWHALGGYRGHSHRLGPHPHHTPLSLTGPACSGSIVAISGLSAAALSPIISAWLGRRSLGKRPWHQRSTTDRLAERTKRKSDAAEAHTHFPWGCTVPRAVVHTALVHEWDMDQDTRCQLSDHADDPNHPNNTLSPCHFCAAVYCSNCVPNIPACHPMSPRYACSLCAVEWKQALQTYKPALLDLLTPHNPSSPLAAQPPASGSSNDSSSSYSDSDDDNDASRPLPDHHTFVHSSTRIVPFYFTNSLRPPCPLCGLLGEDPAHYILHCTHPALAAAQASVRATADAFVHKLEHLCHSAMEASAARGGLSRRAALPLLPRLPAANADWTSAEGQFILYKLLLTAPWSEAAVPPHATLALALGKLFDNVSCENSHLRGLTRTWALWASKNLLSIIDARRNAIKGLPAWRQKTIGTVVGL